MEFEDEGQSEEGSGSEGDVESEEEGEEQLSHTRQSSRASHHREAGEVAITVVMV